MTTDAPTSGYYGADLRLEVERLRATLEWIVQIANDPPAGTYKGKLRYIAAEAQTALDYEAQA